MKLESLVGVIVVGFEYHIKDHVAYSEGPGEPLKGY